MPVWYKSVPTAPPEESCDHSTRHGYRTGNTAVGEPSASVGEEQGAHVRVKNLRIYDHHSRWCLFIGLAFGSYIHSLDASVTSAYLTFATSSFGEHSLLSSLSVVNGLIVAVGGPVIAKVADVSSRGRACVVVLFFYVLGYTTVALAPNVSTMAGGIILRAVGFTGLQILLQVIVADITTLKWRGLVSSLVLAPYLVNAFISPNISTAVIEHVGWRWGYGMFAILLPVSLSPLIVTLLWAEYKSKKLGLILDDSQDAIDEAALPDDTLLQRLRRTAEQLDLVGLVLLGAAVSLILLPLTLSQTVKGQWKNGLIISMFVTGIIFLCVFVYWDLRVAKWPIIAPRFLKNRGAVFAALTGFFDFVSFYLTFTYLYSFVLVVKTWSLINATYFMQTLSIFLTLSGILTGIGLHALHRFKAVLVLGVVARFTGAAMMIHARGANGSDIELVFTQMLQGFGGGIAAVAVQVGAQAAVSHADVAMITALVSLFSETGGAVGNACAGMIWSRTMPGHLQKYLPWLTDAERAKLYGSITSVRSFPRGDPVREGVILAYGDTMRVMIWSAVALSIVPILCVLVMPDRHLGDEQSAVDREDLTGRVLLRQEDVIDAL